MRLRSRRAGRHVWIALPIAVASGACLLSIDEGAIDAIEAAARDASRGEGAVTNPETGTSADGASARLCDSVDASLCVDFDREPLGTRWTEIPTTSPSRLFELTDGSFVSPPYAARIGVLREDSGAPFFHDMVWERSALTKRVHIELRVKLEALEGTSCSGLVRIGLGGNLLDVPLGTSQNGCAAQENAPDSFQDVPITGRSPLGEWTKVAIDLDVATTPHFEVRFENVVVGSHDLGASWRTRSEAGRELVVHVGLQYVAPPTRPNVMLLDDILIDAT
jgi:hypothetical protein